MKRTFAFILSSIVLVGCNSGTETNKKQSELSDDTIDVNNIPIKREPIGTEDIDVIEHEFIEFKEGSEFSDEETVKSIFDEALVNGKAYSWLRHLTKEIGPRLSGSQNAEEAVNFTHMVMDTMGIERVWKQGLMVPHWVRGEKEVGKVLNSKTKGTFELDVCALGGSIATPVDGITAELVYVNNFKELEELGREAVEGKIVFFNRRMDPRFINTFYAYGSCVDQRWGGAMEAAKYGAVAVLVRSMTLSLDDYPHTGSMGYNDDVPKIPAMSISTNGAVELAKLLKKEPKVEFYMKQSCKTLTEKPSYNVVGEIKGSEFPNEIIIVGGHLDSWDLGEGAHDDGAGCVQSLEVLRILNEMGVKPKRTIRAVMFMNEENGLRGGKKYAELAKLNGEQHIAAIETDRGGFAPRYFSVENANEEKLDSQMVKLRSWLDLLFDYGIYDFKQGGSGADISPLKEQGPLLIGLVPESQRYFDYHHAASDVLEAVNERELHMSAAAMTALIYLISEHGI
ncbi:MAG: M20/M25/M40 family metallo-hydrolase [Bacteroidia bacterium]